MIHPGGRLMKKSRRKSLRKSSQSGSHHKRHIIMPDENLFSRHSRRSKRNLHNLIIPKSSHRHSHRHRHHGEESSESNFDMPNVWDFDNTSAEGPNPAGRNKRRSKISKRKAHSKIGARKSMLSGRTRYDLPEPEWMQWGTKRKSKRRSLVNGRNRKNEDSANWMHWGTKRRSKSRSRKKSKSHSGRKSRKSSRRMSKRHSISGLLMDGDSRLRPRARVSKMSKLDKLNYIKNKLEDPNNSEIINHHVKILTSDKKNKKEMIMEIYNRTWYSKSELNAMLKKEVKAKYQAIKNKNIRPRTILGLVAFLAKKEGVKQTDIKSKYKSNSPNFKSNLQNAYDKLH